MAVNVMKELDFLSEMENDNAADENKDSIASLLLNYSQENNNNNNNNNNIKNNNDEDEDTSGLSSLLSKFSLKKLRSQKWSKPVARFSNIAEPFCISLVVQFYLFCRTNRFYISLFVV